MPDQAVPNLPNGADAAAPAPATAPNPWRTAALALALAIFGQTFHYMKDIPPAWALSKAFPILSLPLCLPVLFGRRPPLVNLWLGVLAYLILVPSCIAIRSFDQNFFLGLTAQVKLLPMLYILSFLGLLLLLRPSVDEVQRAYLYCGAAIFVTLTALWLFAPMRWYVTEYSFGDAPLLSADDRGIRIRMPMYFGLIAIFFLYRRLIGKPRAGTALALAFALVLLVAVVKTRATVLAAGGTLVIIAFLAAKPALRLVAGGLALLAAVGLTQIPYVASAFDTSAASGFGVRRTTILKAAGFLGDDPLRWLFGVGTITPLQPDGLSRFFNHFFFLADISWLGIVFEYGLIGALMMVALLATTLWFGVRVRRHLDTPLLGALQDYVLFTILLSPLYATMTLQPGEIAVIAATFLYCWMLIGQQHAGDSRFAAATRQ